ncbi:Cyclopropane-fatty-acyl-phospholipid/mycolic acid synthase [Neofusicoccum parvum]|uniref:Cyclopropane-fatty-acyl-phospholipid/mycolic acid synthase n=1 Tax=Neofusicoccum parvum TaxID=310453 RepID=A0ACB5SNN2_9PEZI|nr:Cyclopropane-fatty-acyl-phospholipid/mycolic acid synthase [Neofusicoccum parvum]
MMLFADMGFAESYMLGEVSCPNLTAFFELFILNREELSDGSTITSTLSTNLAGLARATNTLSNARLNIAAHYDISNDMFAAFLSPDMTYSCPIWLPKSSPLSASESLEAAQIRKLDRFISNAHLKSTDHVLEIGTGWGSLAIRAVQTTGCRVTSLTLSTEQKELAEERIRDAGLEDRIEVLLCDYRALPPPQNENGAYDKIISIEMLEAVGKEFLVTYFECVNRLLKKDGGIAVFQCITMPETRYDAYASSDDFIRRYIFPGGHLPTVSQLVASINAGSRKTLIVDDIENIGPHYAKTLRLWREEFMQNFDERIKPSLLVESEKRGQAMGKKDVETFRRKWEYYFTYCEAGFRAKTLGDVIITTCGAALLPDAKAVLDTFFQEVLRHPDALASWALLRNATQPLVWLDHAPPPDGPFESGYTSGSGLAVEPFESAFANWTVDQLSEFYVDYMASDAIPPETRLKKFDPFVFVVLDERGAGDKTAVVMYHDWEMPEELNEKGVWDEEQAVKTWRSWRVPMRTVGAVTGLLTVHPASVVEMFEEDEKPDENGVSHYRETEEEIEEYERNQQPLL